MAVIYCSNFKLASVQQHGNWGNWGSKLLVHCLLTYWFMCFHWWTLLTAQLKINSYLLQSGLADTVVGDAQPLLVTFQLKKHRGPSQVSTRQLVCH